MRTVLFILLLMESYSVSAQILIEELPTPPLTPFDDGVGFELNGDYFFGLGMDQGFQLSSTIYKYDESSLSWTNTNFPGDARQYSASCGCGNTGYIVGGSTNSGASDEIWEYNSSNNSWRLLTHLPDGGRAKLVAHCYFHSLIIGSGVNGNSVNSSFWRYDKYTDAWTEWERFPTEVYSLTSFLLNDTLVVGMGRDSLYQYTEFYYTTTANTGWRYLNTFPGTPRFGNASLSYNHLGYIFGGEDSTGNLTDEIWAFNLGANSWTLEGMLNDSIRGCVSVGRASEVFLMGGLTPAGRTNKFYMISGVLPNSNLVFYQQNDKLILNERLNTSVDYEIYDSSGRLLQKGIMLPGRYFSSIPVTHTGIIVIRCRRDRAEWHSLKMVIVN